MLSPTADTVERHTRDYHDFRARLLGLYEREGAVLAPKSSPWGLGTTFGYWLREWRGTRASTANSAASIGEDEIRLFYDLCQLVLPESAFVVGHSFGLSTFCLALAAPELRVVAIDNWSERDTTLMHRPLSEAIIAAERWERVHIHTGTSPQDTAAAIAAGGLRTPLSIAFIDGWHRDEAASADFGGLLPFLDERSVVMWHNVHLTARAFHDSGAQRAAELFDQQLVLRTYGPLGIYFSSRAHPLLAAYLHDGTFVWPEWTRYVDILTHEDELRRFRQLRATTLWRLGAALSRPLRQLRSSLTRSAAHDAPNGATHPTDDRRQVSPSRETGRPIAIEKETTSPRPVARGAEQSITATERGAPRVP